MRESPKETPVFFDSEAELRHYKTMKTLICGIILWSSVLLANTVVSQTVGQAGDVVVTSREVTLSGMVAKALGETKKSPLQMGDKGFKEEVNAVLLEVIVAKEADSFNVVEITDPMVSSGLASVEKAYKNNVLWKKLEPTPEEIKDLVIRKIKAREFLNFKTNSLKTVISDQEARSYFERNRSKFSGHSFDTFQDNIKTMLSQRQLENRLKSWFEVIQRKYKVRNLLQ